jgi:hypothetical protein
LPGKLCGPGTDDRGHFSRKGGKERTILNHLKTVKKPLKNNDLDHLKEGFQFLSLYYQTSGRHII